MTEHYAYITELETKSVTDVASLVEAAMTQEDLLRLNPSGPTLKEIWLNLRNEVYDLLCTKSAKDQTERSLLNTAGAPTIAALTAYLTRSFGIPIAAASSLSSLALLLPLKMTINAWCAAVSSTPTGMSTAELQAVKEVAAK